MHVQLPKPLHGWRAFAGEVGIIVIGVLIALGFGSVVDDLQWQSKVKEGREQLRHEVAHNLALLDLAISLQSCVDRRTQELGAIITEASATGRLPAVGPIGAETSGTFPTSVWESQIAADTMTHFPAEQTAALSRVYRFIGAAHEDSRSEEKAWLTLNTIVGPGRPIDPASISRLLEALSVLKEKSGVYKFYKQGVFRILVGGGLGSDFPQLDRRNPPILGGRRKPLICQSIGKPPRTY